MPDFTIRIPAIDKLLDYTASGVGAIAGPMLANWKATREGRARITAARADAEVREIEAGSEARSLGIIADAQAQAKHRLAAPDEEVRGEIAISREDIAQSMEFQGRKRLANVKSVMDYAADELGDKEVDDHEPDPDWTARFFNEVQDVSSEDMQRIWARILAGEVESPGRTSLRTLDILRNMTRKDAEMFKGICDFVINNDFVFYHGSVKDFEALDYSKFLHLQDCGLVTVGPSLTKVFEWQETKESLLLYQDGILEITGNVDAKDILRIPAARLTSAGKELSPLVQGTYQLEYLHALSEFLKSEKHELHYLQGIKHLPDEMIQYTSRTLIEPDSEQSIEAAP